MTITLRQNFHNVDLESWYAIVQRSIREPTIEGVELPRFPHPSIQRSYVGAADDAALEQARNFHNYMIQWSKALGHPIDLNSRVLDFGSSWGRVTRYFWHEVDRANLYGVDVDADAVAVCINLGVPGQFSVVAPDGRLPYSDGTMDHIFAVSVFTHLSETSADHWMSELYRAAKPGCVLALTLESRQFIEEITSLSSKSASLRHTLLAQHKERVPQMLRDFDAAKFVYMENGTGDGRSSQYNGDAAVSADCFQQKWGKLFRLCGYVEAHEHLGQAFAVAVKD